MNRDPSIPMMGEYEDFDRYNCHFSYMHSSDLKIKWDLIRIVAARTRVANGYSIL